MICYTLECKNEHNFEAWFRDSATCDTHLQGCKVECPICGDDKIGKAVMAPNLAGTKRDSKRERPPTSVDVVRDEIRTLRKKVEEEATYVGRQFFDEARKIHAGESETKSIYGEANLSEVKALHEDGIECMPLPWSSRRTD